MFRVGWSGERPGKSPIRKRYPGIPRPEGLSLKDQTVDIAVIREGSLQHGFPLQYQLRCLAHDAAAGRGAQSALALPGKPPGPLGMWARSRVHRASW